MIAGLQPYPAMKDSGVEWLGEVPEHWELVPNRAIVRRRKVLVGESHERYRLLSLTKQGVIVRDMDNLRGKFSADMGTSQEVRPGDLVFCLFDVPETPRTVGLSMHHGMITGAYTVFEPLGRCSPRFFELFYIAMDDRKLLGPLYSGLRNTIPPPVFLGAKTPLPSPDEQAAIVRFLDYVDRRIRRYIRAKQKLIKLLEEQKQAIIHRAVTRGLDPNVRLKPSGVEWLGDVPEHWEVAALRRRWSVTDCKHLTVPFVGDASGIPLASVREVQSFELSLAQAKRTTREHYESLIEGGRKPEEGDLIYCRNVSVGAAAIVTTNEPLAMGQDVCLIRSIGESQRYLNYFLRSPAMRHQLAMLLVGSTFNRINVADIKALLVIVPPRREQDAIANHCDFALSVLVRAQSLATNEISLLREYRTRLIADVVTGKLDVREAAARLPDETEEPEPPDEFEAEGDTDEAGADDTDIVPEEAEV